MVCEGGTRGGASVTNDRWVRGDSPSNHARSEYNPPLVNTRRVLRTAAGPTLIVVLVLFAMRGFVFRDVLSDQHPDILAFWLPRWCYLGHSLRTGHVPVWNSLQFAGSPF